jgi:ribosomal protein S18 acetylase RimI-like enzyme
MEAMAMRVRDAEEAEIVYLAKLWYDGWRDAHEQIVPAKLKRLRTEQSFEERMRAAIAAVRVIGPPGEPVGFCMLKGDELYQLYVSAQARGSGAAAALMADAEARLSDSGFGTAWLACAIGNERAARFYEKCGWRRVGTMVNRLETPEGEFLLEVWRYEKQL